MSGKAIRFLTGIGLLLACSLSARAQLPAFFNGAVPLGSHWNYLQFANGHLFGYYNEQYSPDVYHNDLGWEHVIDAGDGQNGVYLYDYAGSSWFYTTPALFPTLYDFALGHSLTYQLDLKQTGHYTSNPRKFIDLSTSQLITLGPAGAAIGLLPSTPNLLSITGGGNGGGNTGHAPPGVTGSFAFTFNDAFYGANYIVGGQVSLMDGTGQNHCQLSWGRPNTLDSSDGGFCTVSLVSIVNSTSDPGAVTVTLNYTFTGAAPPGDYSVIAVVYDKDDLPSPPGTVGTWTVDGTAPFTIGGQLTLVGSPFTGATMTLSGSQTGSTTTDSNGNWSFSVSAGGNYTITASASGYSFSPASVSFNNLLANQLGVSFQVARVLPPSIANVSPDNDTHGASGTITISGANFAGAVVSIAGVNVGQTAVTNSTTLTVTYSVSTLATIGSHTLTVTGAGGTATSAFYVLPTVTITADPGIPINGTIQASVTLSSASTAEPIILSLPTTPQTTGSARFGGGASQTITSSQTITLVGVTASSTADNIQLVATSQNHAHASLASQSVSVVSVAISVRSGPGLGFSEKDTLSGPSNNFVLTGYIIPAGLPGGPSYPVCAIGRETVGVVTPTNYAGGVVLRRNWIRAAIFYNQTEFPSNLEPTAGSDDTTFPKYRIDTPSTTGGVIFDIDSPGIGAGSVASGNANDVAYARMNFQSYAVILPSVATPDNPQMNLPGAAKAVGVLNNYTAVSCAGPTLTPGFSATVAGDNLNGTGSINLTWDLK